MERAERSDVPEVDKKKYVGSSFFCTVLNSIRDCYPSTFD